MTGCAEARSASIASDAPPSSAHPTSSINIIDVNGEFGVGAIIAGAAIVTGAAAIINFFLEAKEASDENQEFDDKFQEMIDLEKRGGKGGRCPPDLQQAQRERLGKIAETGEAGTYLPGSLSGGELPSPK